MAEIGGVRKYLYWSDRRIRDIAEDNSIPLPTGPATTVSTPSVPLLPQAGASWEARPPTRHEVASRIEGALGSLAVTDYVSPSPVRFAKGRGTIALAEFDAGAEQADLGIAATMAPTSASDGRQVGVCLFGSLTNFADFLTDTTPKQTGWSSSAAPAVRKAILHSCRQLADIRDLSWPHGSEIRPEDLAVETAKIAFGQGERLLANGAASPMASSMTWASGWRRSGSTSSAPTWTAGIAVHEAAIGCLCPSTGSSSVRHCGSGRRGCGLCSCMTRRTRPAAGS